MASGILIDGRWEVRPYKADGAGRFERQKTLFRSKVGDDDFPLEEGRYRLYVSYACPWAHRTLIARALLGLESAIPVSVVHPHMLEQSWEFKDDAGRISPEPVFGAEALWQVYARAEPGCNGRVTVPVLLDTVTKRIVNNESREIVRMFGRVFRPYARNADIDLCPPGMQDEIEAVIDALYEPVNNGVYRAGFAQSQAAYEEAARGLFAALQHWDDVLGRRRWLCGDTLTEADIALFTTLLRFDPVYYVHFKCSLKHIWDYPNLWRFLRRLYHHPAIQPTIRLDHIVQHYFVSHPHINPSGLVPIGPVIDYGEPPRD
ncbi:MAG TPA: glutathione S-transferase family protein [Aromatoleum sp.]|uniref:glutathione S-transferase family protein n=1 Tax=Aromatoleum sp. TaxID=2307007 RepID=UPI002B463E2D|nr:glutathione S-transferase family protein [Aromatoleum sp.]HJV25995.1 glutathione S-transferase family protein [Aromatoleum sp.]